MPKYAILRFKNQHDEIVELTKKQWEALIDKHLSRSEDNCIVYIPTGVKVKEHMVIEGL